VSVLRPGERFGDFVLGRELGRGSVGRVFLATAGGRRVVLKIAPSLLGEAHVLGRLRHPNVTPVLSVRKISGLEVIIQPYFGETSLACLARVLRRLPAPPLTGRPISDLLAARFGTAGPGTPAAGFAGRPYLGCVLWLGARVADALAHAHAEGVLHCDLKPNHVLMTGAGEPVLFDFNAASERRRGPGEDGRCIGATVPYAAPEQLMLLCGERVEVTPRSDVYALGVLLLELAAGRPFHENDAGEDLPPPVRAILHRCVAPDPAHRYSSAEELAVALRSELRT
jgi:eukaryotic-like serine/threonine-protein kinase